MNIYGMNVITSPLLEPLPKLALSEACPCSKKVREDFNKWLLEMFGREPSKAYVLGDGTVVVAPSEASKLKADLLDIYPLFAIAERFAGGVYGL